MKVCHAQRHVFYLIIELAFKKININPIVAEIGVLRGDNAKLIYDTLKPKIMYLIDPWKAYSKFHYPFEERPYYIAPESAHNNYFGGSLKEQSTFDKIYDTCVEKFKDMSNVFIIREDSISALNKIKNSPELSSIKFDFIYIDGDHEYEYVLRDLMYWSNLCHKNSVLMLNDCCHSALGAAQNLGVLPAVSEFIKRTDFIPVLLTNTDWSDVVLVRKNSDIFIVIDEITRNSNIPYVEVPPILLPSMKVVYGSQRVNVSFII